MLAYAWAGLGDYYMMLSQRLLLLLLLLTEGMLKKKRSSDPAAFPNTWPEMGVGGWGRFNLIGSAKMQ